jgi:cob(I)alamin adenosyltransferase
MKIYTKTGDDGQTSLLGGTRVAKNHWRLKIYGGLDEVNSHLGLVAALLEDKGISASGLERLENYTYRIQGQLFCFGSHFASENSKAKHLPKISEQWIAELEAEIDYMEEELDPLKNFILPGGSRTAGVFHMARSLCRRVERELVENEKEFEKENSLFLFSQMYLNRLSDFLFVAARFCNQKQGKKDRIWIAEKQ